MTPFEEAQRLALELARPLGAETVALGAALGRIAFEDVIAHETLVPFARSAMDGYAVRAADTVETLSLRVRGEIFAGGSAIEPLGSRSAAKIATGAPLPPGADAVVPVERTSTSNGSVIFAAPAAAGDHVFPPGEDALPGQVLARAGVPLDAGTIALLASAGERSPRVFRRPAIAVVCSGDELVDFERTPGYGQIRNSNTLMLKALIESAGAECVSARIAPDDPAALSERLGAALDASDLLITTGGASVGERDYMKRSLVDLGVAFAFTSVAMRPGRPAAFGARASALAAVLPGNPAAVFVAFHELVRPVIARLAGATRTRAPRVRAVLNDHVRARPERTFFAFARLAVRDGRLEAQLLDNQCSALNRLGAESQGLVVVPPSAHDLPSGSLADIDVFAWDGIGIEPGNPAD